MFNYDDLTIYHKNFLKYSQNNHFQLIISNFKPFRVDILFILALLISF